MPLLIYVRQRAIEEQQFNLRSGAEIIIATPGRLRDVIERHVLVLSQCRYIVMDEADRMVNLGFEADLLFILDKLPADTMEGEDKGEQMDVDGETMIKRGRTRVTTLFSATMPPPVERLAKKYLRRPAIVTIGEAGRAVDTVEQRVEFVQGDERKKWVLCLHLSMSIWLTLLYRQRLIEILNSGQYPSPIIVFVNQKKTADQVAKDLQRAQVRPHSSHLTYRGSKSCVSSGALLHFTQARTRSSEKPLCSPSAMANPMSWSLPISPVVVLMCKMCRSLSTSRWRTRLKHTYIVSVCRFNTR